MISRTANQNSKAAYYSITLFSALQFICHELVPAAAPENSTGGGASLEPEVEGSETESKTAEMVMEVEMETPSSAVSGFFLPVLVKGDAAQIQFYCPGDQLGARQCQAALQLADVEQLIVHPTRAELMIHTNTGALSLFKLANPEATVMWVLFLREVAQGIAGAGNLLRSETERRTILTVYTACAFSAFGMRSGENPDETASALTDDAKWDLVVENRSLNFGHELACRKLYIQISKEIVPSKVVHSDSQGLANVLSRLVFSPHRTATQVTGDGSDSVLAAVADNIKTEPPTARIAYDEQNNPFTQYHMEVHLWGKTWAVETRWSELENFEKQIKQLFKSTTTKKLLPKLKKGGHKVGSSVRNVKTWARSTDANLVDERRIAIHQYTNRLFGLIDALRYEDVLQFILPLISEVATDPGRRLESMSGATTHSDEQGDDDAVIALPPACTWDEGWQMVHEPGTPRSLYQDAEALESDLRPRRGVHMASTNALVIQISSSQMMDIKFTNMFLATYRKFFDSITLLMTLWDR
jgi:hypothetical protein